jgi:hypothetical protein
MLIADFIDSVEAGFDEFWEWLPRVLGAIAVLLVAWLVAKFLAGLTRRVLDRVGVDRHVAAHGPDFVKRAAPNVTGLVAGIVFWLVILAGFGFAADVLGVEGVQDAVSAIWAYIPNVLAAVAIIVIAALLAPFVGRMISAALPGRPLGDLLATTATVVILALGVFMALDQLNIAPQIVMITYAALVGSVALGMALAFGLGGRDAAAEAIRSAREQVVKLAGAPSGPPPPGADSSQGPREDDTVV